MMEPGIEADKDSCGSNKSPAGEPLPRGKLCYSARERLRNGEVIYIRSVRRQDGMLLQEILRNLSEQSRYFRFLIPKSEYSQQELDRLTANSSQHVALLAFIFKDGRQIPIGIGEYFLSPDYPYKKTAELAFSVEEAFQGLGVATVLLNHLIGIATKTSLEAFTALVHPDNDKMLAVFRHSGLPMSMRTSIGAVRVRLELRRTAAIKR